MAVPKTQPHAPAPPHPTVANTVERLMLEERTRWAMLVHDGLTQAVTSAVLEIQTLRHRIEAEPAEAIATLHQVEAAIRGDLRDIRDVLFELQEEGRAHEQAPLAALAGALAARWKLRARITSEGDLESLGDEVYESAHGIIAEALANVAKHSGSADVRIRLRVADGALAIDVEDHGGGVPIAAVTDEDQHFGIRMMRTRAVEAGGTFEMASTPGHGTRVVAVLPVGGRGEER
jgi:two-component system nitrate/nitrite sensor histidine kinase NarX